MIALLFAALLSVQDAEAPINCAEPANTLEIDQCLADEVGREEDRMQAYLVAAIAHAREEGEEVAGEAGAADGLVRKIEAGQAAWADYAEKACGAVYTRWQGGTIRVAKALDCRLRLTFERTRHLWQEYLTYWDSTPPILPEPTTPAPDILP